MSGLRWLDSCGIAVLLVCALIGGCGASASNELTRSKAEDVLRAAAASDQGKHQNIPLTKGDVDAGVQAGYFEVVPPKVGGGYIALTAKGKQFFSFAVGRGDIPGKPGVQYTATPLALIKAKVLEVTGITDGPDRAKLVEFRWTFDVSGVPQEVRDTVLKELPTGVSQATFKLYDDGWRYVSARTLSLQ